ncbi:nucleic-acid-binding protein from transposon X-element [Trichonephila clavipes]|nr:nucleic-acid-binding protein from transposon X-element [Trichonephila clavipes]
MIPLLKAHCHPPINDRFHSQRFLHYHWTASSEVTPHSSSQVSKIRKIRVPDRGNNTNMPLFLVVLKKNEENKQIFQITNIGFFRVVIEPLKGSWMPPQCYRCQEFYHHSRLCNRTPKCLKCSGSHLTADCKKSTKSPAKCANCGGTHPANFSGCPRNPINRKQQENQPNKTSGRRRPRSPRKSPHHDNRSRLMLR